MAELIKNEIGENKISEKIGKINRLEIKIKESYKEIYETKGELQDLKAEVTKNLSGKELKEMLENELTIDHVKHVLQNVIKKFNERKDKETFMSIYNEMGAGLVFNLQLALAKLGCKFKMGIDGMYGNGDTRLRVLDFQTRWNDLHCNDGQHGTPDEITLDGWAGIETIKRVLLALDDPTWDSTQVNNYSTLPKKGKKAEVKKDKAEEEDEDEEDVTVKTPAVDTVKTPAVDTVKTPAVDTVKTPAVDTVKTPAVDTVKTPAVDTVKTPAVDTVKTPAVDTVKTPAVDTVKTPAVDTVKTPIDSNKTKVELTLAGNERKVYDNGNIYEGKFVNGKPDGIASVTFMGKKLGTEWKDGTLLRVVIYQP